MDIKVPYLEGRLRGANRSGVLRVNPVLWQKLPPMDRATIVDCIGSVVGTRAETRKIEFPTSSPLAGRGVRLKGAAPLISDGKLVQYDGEMGAVSVLVVAQTDGTLLSKKNEDHDPWGGVLYEEARHEYLMGCLGSGLGLTDQSLAYGLFDDFTFSYGGEEVPLGFYVALMNTAKDQRLGNGTSKASNDDVLKERPEEQRNLWKLFSTFIGGYGAVVRRWNDFAIHGYAHPGNIGINVSDTQMAEVLLKDLASSQLRADLLPPARFAALFDEIMYGMIKFIADSESPGFAFRIMGLPKFLEGYFGPMLERDKLLSSPNKRVEGRWLSPLSEFIYYVCNERLELERTPGMNLNPAAMLAKVNNPFSNFMLQYLSDYAATVVPEIHFVEEQVGELGALF